MNISEVLDADWEAVGPLRDPVLVVALRGWFDVAGVATGALEWSVQDRDVVVVGSIDPDPFFDFTQERPETYLDEDGDRHIRWPENELDNGQRIERYLLIYFIHFINRFIYLFTQ